MTIGSRETKPETRRLLTAADYFLQCRNFADCYKYAARARDSDPIHPSPTRILSIASVLSVSKISSTLHDYYAVLNLPYFYSDAARIGSSFKTLASILDPNANPSPLSSEALDLVMKAWSVLSNPVDKVKYDDELRRSMTNGCTSKSGGGTFWTMCPYCYYVYEYDEVFEDCCLSCENERCRRVLHAVAIGAPPPPDVVEKGYYLCPGFMPLAIRNSIGEETREKLWNPFEPAIGSAGVGCDRNVRDCVVVSDDEKVRGEEFRHHGDGIKTKNEDNAINHGHSNWENFEDTMEKSVKEVRMKRKSVPWNSKILMGRGTRIDNNHANFINNVVEEGHSNVDRNEGKLSEPLFCGAAFDEAEIGLEFLEGVDDVFLILPCDLDFVNGEV